MKLFKIKNYKYINNKPFNILQTIFNKQKKRNINQFQTNIINLKTTHLLFQ